MPHDLLLIKLWKLGLTGSAWKWIREYLTGRMHQTRIEGCTSSLLSVSSGVPQGSVLGPLLFVLYINDLPSHILFSSSLLFADDCKCISRISSLNDCHNLQQDLNSLYDWSCEWRLPFNSNKCKSMHVSLSSPPNQSAYQYCINDVLVSSTSNHRDLGVIMSSDLSWSDHYNIIISKAFKVLHFLRRILSPHHSVSTKLQLYTTLIRSHFSFCSQVWHPHLIKDIKSIERVQRKSTKFILNDYYSCYKSRLLTLQLLPLSMWLELLDIMFLVINLKNPQSHFNIFSYVQYVRSKTRSSSQNKLQCTLPYASNNRLNFFYFNRVVRLWNSLPIIDLEESIPTIKYKLRLFLWNHFLDSFVSNRTCTWFYSCPCSNCSISPTPKISSFL